MPFGHWACGEAANMAGGLMVSLLNPWPEEAKAKGRERTPIPSSKGSPRAAHLPQVRPYFLMVTITPLAGDQCFNKNRSGTFQI